MDTNWIRPTLILSALFILITLNVLEFKGKRKRDTQELASLLDGPSAETRLAYKQYLQTQNIEQVLHIINSVLIAILVAVLSL